MKAKLVGINSNTHESEDIEKDPYDCIVGVFCYISREGSAAEEMFSFKVYTVKALNRVISKEGYLLGHHTLVIEKFDWGVVRQTVERVLNSLQAETWDELAQKINEHYLWEFAYINDPYGGAEVGTIEYWKEQGKNPPGPINYNI